jgi:hypothetical protein
LQQTIFSFETKKAGSFLTLPNTYFLLIFYLPLRINIEPILLISDLLESVAGWCTILEAVVVSIQTQIEIFSFTLPGLAASSD